MFKALVLLSGGLDSATILWQFRKKYQTYALTFKYHNRNRNEVKAAKKLVEIANIDRHLIVDVGFLREICEIPELRNSLFIDRSNIPPTYVPSRNMVFFGIASHFSEIMDIQYIVTGHSLMDSFPDSKSEYVELINKAISHGSWLANEKKNQNNNAIR